MENLTNENQNLDKAAPGINFDAKTGVCELFGESYLENHLPFYKTATNWLKEYINTVKGAISFNFKYIYFNTRSSKSILEILILLKEYQTKGGKVEVNWFYDPENKIAMFREVDDFMADADININLYPIS